MNLIATRVQPNEVIKADDVNSGYEFAISNVCLAFQSILDTNKNFVIGGKVEKGQNLSIKINPVFGVNIDDGFKPVVETDVISTYSIEPASSSNRVDTVLIRGVFESTTKGQRAFIDFATGGKQLQDVDTRTELKLEVNIIQGESGSVKAPDTILGWIKIAEIFVPATAINISDCTIYPVSADIPDAENDGWTNDKTATYNFGSLSSFRALIRNQHNIDGSHKDGVIGKKELNLTGTDGNKITGAALQVGANINVSGDSSITSVSVISDALLKISSKINDLYNLYLKHDGNNFGGPVYISPKSFDKTNALKLVATGNKTAELYIGDTKVFTIGFNTDKKAYIRTVDYKATNILDLVTKSITNALDSRLSGVETTVTELKRDFASVTESENKVISIDRYKVSTDEIIAATTTNIDLTSNTSRIDGVEVSDGNIVLVWKQTNGKENGVYQVSTSSSWSRVESYKTPLSLSGKLWNIKNGTNNGGKILYTPIDTWINPDEEAEIAFTEDEPYFIEYIGTMKSVPNRPVVRDKNGIVYGEKLPTDATNTSKMNQVTDPEKLKALASISFLADVLFPKGFVYEQLPGCLSPVEMGMYGTWREIKFGGAYMRSAGGNNSKEFTSKFPCSVSGTNLTFTSDYPNLSQLKVGDILISGDNYATVSQIEEDGINVISATLDNNNLSGVNFVLIGSNEELPNIKGNTGKAFISKGGEADPEGMEVESKGNQYVVYDGTWISRAEMPVYSINISAQNCETNEDGTLKDANSYHVYKNGGHVTTMNLTSRYWERVS